MTNETPICECGKDAMGKFVTPPGFVPDERFQCEDCATIELYMAYNAGEPPLVLVGRVAS